jgi:hypothetical protein
MPFGLNASKASGDVPDIVKYDARAGRLFRVEYDPDPREKEQIDITSPPPKFAMDFGSLEVGYVRYTPTGPDYRMARIRGRYSPARPPQRQRYQ